jgi:Arc/MetJ-type ribon-helix-helix transcriptional regulator
MRYLKLFLSKRLEKMGFGQKREPHRLLILSCSARKRRSPATPIAAIERYDGVWYRVLRAWLRLHGDGRLEIIIISAKYGVITGNDEVEWYDEVITPGALLSTGPKTPEGKAIVSRNRLIHGLTAKRSLLLEGEEPRDVDQLFETLKAELQPLDRIQCAAWLLNVTVPHGMVFGMATTKITITLPDDQVEEIRALVAAGKAASVSAFVKHAVGVALFDAAGWREMLEDALRQTGGPLTQKERAWADAILSPQGRKGASRRRKAA